MKQVLQILLTGYKCWISPALPNACRFVPTCSEYAMEAVDRHGALRGSLLALGRLVRCHPFGGSGYDPVPREFGMPGFALKPQCCGRTNSSPRAGEPQNHMAARHCV